MLVIVPRVLAGAMPAASGSSATGTRAVDWATLALVLIGLLAFARWAHPSESP